MICRHIAAVTVALLAVTFAAPVHACFTINRTVSNAELDQHVRRSLERLPELFEGEIIRVGSRRALAVSRVFRGQLQPGAILRAEPHVVVVDSCTPTPPAVGDRGILMVGFGPNGPSYVDSFVRDDMVAALRRIGAIPAR